MTDHIKITCAGAEDRDALVAVLARNGYTVRQGREKRGKGIPSMPIMDSLSQDGGIEGMR